MPSPDEEIRICSTFLEEARWGLHPKVERKGQVEQPAQVQQALVQQVAALRQATLVRDRELQLPVEFQELVELQQQVAVRMLRSFVSLRQPSKKCDCRMTRSIRNETSISPS